MKIFAGILLVAVLVSQGCSTQRKAEDSDSSIAPSPHPEMGSSQDEDRSYGHISESQPPTSYQPRWINVANSEDGDVAVDIDENSIKLAEPLVFYVGRARYATPRDNASVVAAQQVIDCRSGLYQNFDYARFDAQGNLIETFQQPSQIYSTQPGTLQAAAVNLVCSTLSSAHVPDLQGQMAMESFRYQYEAAEQMQNYYHQMKLQGMEMLRHAYSQRFDSPSSGYYPCDFPWQYDSMGRQCGDRAATERPGGRW